MKPTIRPVWALGAVALTTLIACSPPATTTVVEPQSASTQPRSAQSQSSGLSSTPIGPPPTNIDPGFAGTWASIETECGDPAKVVKLSPKTIALKQGEGDCTVKSIDEEHPTGRSMSYTIVATCVASGRTGEDKFRLNFGASDAVVQFQQNAREPVRLVRCPNP